jgi:succinate dehydrogenase / fumarate reductase cytochrome b subunit
MKLLLKIWRSALGRKYVMALSGGAMLLFVLGHMVGNLQFFLPPTYINAYGHFLQSTPEILWPSRLGLLLMVGLHIAAAISLTASNRAARPTRYEGAISAQGATLAARTMIYSGLVITSFIIFHLLHYTLTLPQVNGYQLFKGTPVDFTDLREPHTGYHDVFAMIVLGFQIPAVTGFYLVAMALLSLHLGHGVASMFQSLGLRNHVWWPRIALMARVLSLVIFVGYASIPLAVGLGRGGDYLNDVITAGKAELSPKAKK